ncbi:hypothetical protein HanPI659440_Chr12g0464491 [Helianthus annuus]|nr:hypothetical protein HanPI659440_Chr12g0464491 [Helianthus annuus]
MVFSVDQSCCMMAMWLSPSGGSGFKQNVPATEVCTWSTFSNRLSLSDNCRRKTDGRRRHRRWSSPIMKALVAYVLLWVFEQHSCLLKWSSTLVF